MANWAFPTPPSPCTALAWITAPVWSGGGVSGYRPPSVAPGVDGVGGAVSSVGLATFEAADALAGQPVGAVGPSDDRPGPGGGLTSPALAIEFDHDVGAQDGVLLLAADPVMQLGRRPLPGGKAPELRATNTGSRAGLAGCPLRWRAASLAHCRTASGFGMPNPWRLKALRSDGQVSSAVGQRH